MMERTGQVRAVTSRDFQSVKLWSFQLEGSDRYFRTGKTEPEITEGEWIKFTEKNGIVVMDTLKQIEENAAAMESSKEPVYTSEEASVSHAPNVGKRIRYQAARADACRIVIAALHTDHLPHAANVAKGKRLDLLLGYVEKVTQSLLEQEEAA